MSLIELFVDPSYRVSTLGSILMCLTSALLGAIAFIKKRSLIGEVLSHACYPGIAVAVVLFFTLFQPGSLISYLMILFFAFLSCLCAYGLIMFFEKQAGVSADAALCLTLASFLGIGVLLASSIQISHPLWLSKIQMFLYGQVATMTYMHLYIYLLFALLVVAVLVIFFPRWKVALFDPQFARSKGMRVALHEMFIATLVVFSIVVGIRAVGVILISGMLIAPALSARQWTERLSVMLVLSGFFGVLSGIAGNFLSLYLPTLIHAKKPLSLPPGPAIIVFSSLVCVASILLAPRRGQIVRWIRRINFQYRCVHENLLKFLWKQPHHHITHHRFLHWSAGWVMRMILLANCKRRGLIRRDKRGYHLTKKGLEEASRIVRLHRLWEAYLFEYLGYCDRRVHASAEEMEHILTPALEKQLAELLKDPQKDPHDQPIPKGER